MGTKLGATPIWPIFGVTGALQSVANFVDLRKGEVRRSPLSRRRTIVDEGSPYRRVSYARRYGDRVTRGLGASEGAEAKGWSRPTGSRPGKADAGVLRPS